MPPHSIGLYHLAWQVHTIDEAVRVMASTQLNRTLDASAALELADALGGFLDSLQIEEVSAEVGLDELVTDGVDGRDRKSVV